MIMAQEQMILKGQVQLEGMVRVVGRAAKDGRPIDPVEGSLWHSLRALGHTLLAGYVEGVGDGDVGETPSYEGGELKRLEFRHERRYVSVFGELTVRRCVYGSREKQKHKGIA